MTQAHRPGEAEALALLREDSKPAHTPEPWARGMDVGVLATIVAGQDGDILMTAYAADADRSVACVNALAGLDPDAVPELVEAARTISEAAWAGLATHEKSTPGPLLKRLDAALAKATGS